MKFFVTGGGGLIGAYVTRQLVAAGHSVTIYDLFPDKDFLADIIPPGDLKRVAIIAGDVTDLAALLRALRASEPQYIIHLAALLSAKSNENPIHSLNVNSGGTLNIFEAALAHEVRRVVWASSVGIFGLASKRAKGAVANDAPHTPTDLYGACKSLNERFSKHYRRAFGLDCVGLRYTGVYGYGKSRTLGRGTGASFLGELIDKPAAGLPSVVPAGDAVIDFIHVEDAARATILAALALAVEPVALNIGGFRAALREVADMVREILPGSEILVEDGSWNGVDHHYDLSGAEATIGYSPAISLRDGLRENIAEIRRRM